MTIPIDRLRSDENHDQLVRELDVLLNGEEGAAVQASLCDIVAQVKQQGISRDVTGTIDDLSPWESIKELKQNRDHWERAAKRKSAAADYYQQQLIDAHALLGRVIHQLSERWDTVNLTKYYPTDNPRRKRTINDPTGQNGKAGAGGG